MIKKLNRNSITRMTIMMKKMSSKSMSLKVDGSMMKSSLKRKSEVITKILEQKEPIERIIKKIRSSWMILMQKMTMVMIGTNTKILNSLRRNLCRTCTRLRTRFYSKISKSIKTNSTSTKPTGKKKRTRGREEKIKVKVALDHFWATGRREPTAWRPSLDVPNASERKWTMTGVIFSRKTDTVLIASSKCPSDGPLAAALSNCFISHSKVKTKIALT